MPTRPEEPDDTARDGRKRCGWGQTNAQMVEYHDREWGVPLHDERRLFESLVLDGMQAGLSWAIVLRKREAFREAFDGFDAERVARYTSRQVTRLLKNPDIVRNRLKIEAAIRNARHFLEVQAERGSFDAYLWSFVAGRPIVNHRCTLRAIPARTPVSDRVSADLQKRGFTFVGSTIMYAFMQAAGLVNDHLVSCFRHAEVGIDRGPGE